MWAPRRSSLYPSTTHVSRSSSGLPDIAKGVPHVCSHVRAWRPWEVAAALYKGPFLWRTPFRSVVASVTIQRSVEEQTWWGGHVVPLDAWRVGRCRYNGCGGVVSRR
jgi:hypothetical protein